MKKDSSVLKEYAFMPRGITTIQQDVFKVKTDSGDVCLKRADKREKKIVFIYSVLKHLTEKGFTKVSAPVPTKNGTPIVTEGEDVYFVTEWVPGVPCDFERDDHIAAASRTLAEFHQFSKGMDVLPGGKARSMYDKWPEKLEDRLDALKDFKKKVLKKSKRNDFEQRYLEYADFFITQGEKALQTLKNSAYQEIAKEAEKEGTFTHRDVAARNFIIGKNGEAYLIDFDYCRYDLRITDVVRLIERTLKAHKWRLEKADLILRNYNSINPLKPEEYKVILAFLQFPQKFWRVADRYFNEKKNWQEEGFLKKFNSATKKVNRQEKFVSLFEAKYCR